MTSLYSKEQLANLQINRRLLVFGYFCGPLVKKINFPTVKIKIKVSYSLVSHSLEAVRIKGSL